MSKRLENKCAVITGGNSGIGKATAKRFVEEGAKVLITGRDQEKIDETVSELGESAIGFKADSASLADIERTYAIAKDQLGRIDILFLNAGIGQMESIEETSEELFDRHFDINVKGVFFGVQKAVPLFENGGSIILNSSIANCKGMANFSAYSATKAAVRSFARTFSRELIGRGIRVNAVSPGPIETPIWDRMGLEENEAQEAGEQIQQMVPAGRFGRADEVADAVVFLASDESAYIVGSEIFVDGGMAQL